MAVVLASSIALTACGTKLPTPRTDIHGHTSIREKTDAKFKEDATVAVERIKVPANSMTAVVERAPVPANIAKMPIDIRFPSNHEADLGALVQTMSAVGMQVTFQWSNPTQEESVLQKKLPFLSFEGTVGELLSALQNGLGLVAWYDDGMIYLSDQQRYSISLPQNKDVLDSVSGELEKLGAKNIVSSLRGGKVLYTASPSTQDELIGPYLSKMSKNLAVVTLQVAVVSLNLNDTSSVGFDWDAFKVAFDSTQDGIDAAKGKNDTGTDIPGTDTNVDPTTAIKPEGLVGTLTGDSLTFGNTSLGNVFGKYGALTVGSAINFLSSFGTTDVTQHVSLKTMSGTDVELQSGKEVPYVKGVSNTSSDGGNTTGSSDTDTVETGLKLKLSPFYDSDARVVTVQVDMELNAVLEWVELEAGNEIGKLTQPVVQKQNMKDLVQIQAGKTVVIGGLQQDETTNNTTQPTALRNSFGDNNPLLSGRKADYKRSALFIVLRPTVTIYEREQ